MSRQAEPASASPAKQRASCIQYAFFPYGIFFNKKNPQTVAAQWPIFLTYNKKIPVPIAALRVRGFSYYVFDLFFIFHFLTFRLFRRLWQWGHRIDGRPNTYASNGVPQSTQFSTCSFFPARCACSLPIILHAGQIEPDSTFLVLNFAPHKTHSAVLISRGFSSGSQSLQ